MAIRGFTMLSRAHSQGKLQSSASAGVLASLCLASVIFSYGCSVRKEPSPAPGFERISEKSLTATATTHAAAVSPGEKRREIYHEIKRGETLHSVSRLYQVPVDRLMRFNRIIDPTRIRAGTLIFIPSSSSPAGPQATAVTALLWPLRGPITSEFRQRRHRSRHKGIDINGEFGDTVRAAAGGRVIHAGKGAGGYGKTVLLDHGHGLTTLYAHLSKLLVYPRDRVARGEPIATVGRSGNARGTHLHLEVRRDGRPVDPIPYLQSVTAVSVSGPEVIDQIPPQEQSPSNRTDVRR